MSGRSRLPSEEQERLRGFERQGSKELLGLALWLYGKLGGAGRARGDPVLVTAPPLPSSSCI